MILEAEMDLEILREILKQQYNLIPKILDRSTWSHATVNYYIETESKGRFIAKINLVSEERLISLKKDVHISQLLKEIIPSQNYLQAKCGDYVLITNNRLIRVAEFIPGVPPFDMNMNVFGQIISQLKAIHSFPVSKIDITLPQSLPEISQNRAFLHGDLTEANVLVAEDKIIAVIDFEYASIGPIEWDISKSIVFCWGRMLEVEPQTVFDKALEIYGEAPSKDLTKKLCIRHIKDRLKNNEDNRDKYPNQDEWKQENEYYRQMLVRMEKVTC